MARAQNPACGLKFPRATLCTIVAGAFVCMANADSARAASSSSLFPRTLKICKATIPAGGSGFPFVRIGSSGSGAFTLNDQNCIKFTILPLGWVKVNELVPPSHVLVNIVCVPMTGVMIAGANNNPLFQPGDFWVKANYSPSNVTCTFTNRINS